jgi:phage terminase large subunit
VPEYGLTPFWGWAFLFAPLGVSPEKILVSENPFIPFILEYGPQCADPETGPVRFAREVLGVDLQEWQEEVLKAFGRGERGISIRACHGPGKTFIVACCVIYQLVCRFPQNTLATAPSKQQLEGALVKEVMLLFSRLPAPLKQAYTEKQNHLELAGLPESSFFTARTARAETPEALQGTHCDDGWVLLIADEASGVPEPIFEAAMGSLSGDRVTFMLLSNPTRATGFFYKTHTKDRDLWWTMQVTGVEGSKGYYSPRISKDFVHRMGRMYGENSAAFRIRVLGEFPEGDLDTIIATEVVEAAQNRNIEVPKNARTIWGLDVARFGDDSSALVKRTRLSVLPDITEWSKEDTMQTAGRVHAAWKETPDHERPDEILVDVIGIGAGVADRLRELGLPARGINVSETASMSEKYRNLRTELWFKAKDWLETKNHSLPRCDGNHDRTKCPICKLTDELSILRYKFTSSGKLMAEPKEDLKKRGHDSPNIADAFVLTFASEHASLVHGSNEAFSQGTNWHEPVRRNRMVV